MANNKVRIVSFVSKEDYRKINEKAYDLGLSRSSYIAMILHEHLKE
jgi:predicted DNA binding CopG/RHH family protein